MMSALATILAVFAGSTVMVRGMGAQSAPAQSPVAAPTYQPGIDVQDYDITLDLPDTGAFLRGDVTVTARRSAGVTRLRLDLVDALTVRAVQVNGAAVTAAHAANKIDVPLDGVTSDSVKVRVIYDGAVSDGLVVRKDARGRWTWFGDNWPDRARQWLPTVDHPSDKATVTWRVRAPTGRVVVANGLEQGTTRLTGRDAGRTETRWRESRPIAPYMMVIAAGPIVRFDLREPDCHYGDQGQCVRQSIYVAPENRRWLPGPFLAAGPIVSLFEGLVGPFPYEKLAHLQSSTRFGGMENASAIFYDDKLFATPTITDGLIAHETAHQWFGDAVTEREWSHLWLSEGFADYFTAVWVQYIRGDGAFRAHMKEMREKILSDSVVATRPVLDTAQTNYMELLNANSYQKGAYVLFMLHRRLGDSAFFHGIKSYYATYRHGTALTDDLRHEMEKASGQSLGQFFDQWLRRPGAAAPAVGWAWDAASQSVSLFVLQEGRHGAYELPLTVVLTDADNQEHRLVVNVPAEGRATLPLPGRFAARPKSLAFDPDLFLLARITRL
ncbi:MAG TPA: M1 family metallopeptidase [Gemmatimonadaceae bacterium]|jgi:aminopeptidase N|nr:M1 family metallopeptidase [Gemmatimonadaceae bacterium]